MDTIRLLAKEVSSLVANNDNEGLYVARGDGAHDRLLTQKGVYAKLWSHQSDGFIEGF